MHTVAGFETRRVPVHDRHAAARRWGAPLLFGPGSFLVAHTDDEHLSLEELHAAVDSYERLAARSCSVRLQPDLSGRCRLQDGTNHALGAAGVAVPIARNGARTLIVRMVFCPCSTPRLSWPAV